MGGRGDPNVVGRYRRARTLESPHDPPVGVGGLRVDSQQRHTWGVEESGKHGAIIRLTGAAPEPSDQFAETDHGEGQLVQLSQPIRHVDVAAHGERVDVCVDQRTPHRQSSASIVR